MKGGLEGPPTVALFEFASAPPAVFAVGAGAAAAAAAVDAALGTALVRARALAAGRLVAEAARTCAPPLRSTWLVSETAAPAAAWPKRAKAPRRPSLEVENERPPTNSFTDMTCSFRLPGRDYPEYSPRVWPLQRSSTHDAAQESGPPRQRPG